MSLVSDFCSDSVTAVLYGNWKIKLQSSAIITRSNISWYHKLHCIDSSKNLTSLWTHKRYPIPRPPWGAFGEYLGENWPRHNGIALYMEMLYSGTWQNIFHITIRLTLMAFFWNEMNLQTVIMVTEHHCADGKNIQSITVNFWATSIRKKYFSQILNLNEN